MAPRRALSPGQERARPKTGREDALNLVARISAVVAAIIRLREGWGDRSRRATTCRTMKTSPTCSASRAHTRCSRSCSVCSMSLHLDHGGGNLSTFTGKAVASGKADGVREHRGRDGRALRPAPRPRQPRVPRFRQVHRHDGSDGGRGEGSEHSSRPAAWCTASATPYSARKTHARPSQYGFANEHFAENPLVQTALALRQVVPGVLGENKKIKNPTPT